MTKIAYVVTQDRGGPVDVTWMLAKTLLETSNHDVRVFGPPPAGDRGLLKEHITPVKVDHKENLIAVQRMRSILHSWQPDVVHAQDRRSALVVAGLGVGRLAPQAIVQTYHGVPEDVSERWFRGIPHARPPSMYTRAVLAADAVVARHLNRTVVPSPVTGEFLQSRLRVPRQKLIHIDNGVVLPRETPVQSPIRRLIFIGYLNPVKGLLDLLHALCQPGVMPADATLDIVGDGQVRAEAEAFAQRPPLTGRIRFLGFRTDVSDLLSQHDALVLPSRMEQQPLVVAQAMGAGRPVVATRVGDVPQMLEIPGLPQYLAPPGDINALAAALVRLFESTDPVELGRKLAARARDRYSAAASAAAHLKLYDSILT